MNIYYFQYGEVRYCLDVSNNTLRNEQTNETQKICELRNLGIIRAVQELIEKIEKGRFYRIVSKQFINGLYRAGIIKNEK